MLHLFFSLTAAQYKCFVILIDLQHTEASALVLCVQYQTYTVVMYGNTGRYVMQCNTL